LRSSLRVRLRFSVGLLAEVALEEVKGVILWAFFFTARLLFVRGAALLFHLTASHPRQGSCNLWLKKDRHRLNHWFYWWLSILFTNLWSLNNICCLFELDWEIVCIAISYWFIVWCC
jgi:hypothetical protein